MDWSGLRLRQGFVPRGCEIVIGLGCGARMAQLIKNFGRRTRSSKPNIGARKVLVQKWQSQEMRQRLLLGWVAKIRADVATAQKHSARQTPVVCLDQADRALRESKAYGIAPEPEIAD